MRNPRRIAFFFCCFLAAISGRIDASQSVVVSWDPSTDTGVVGYHLFYGTSPDQYAQVLNAPGATAATVSELAEGATYYFAVTAYGTSGVESLFSSQISYVVPGVPGDPGPSPTPAPVPTPSPTAAPSATPLPTVAPTATPVSTPPPVVGAPSLTVSAKSIAVGELLQVTLVNSMQNSTDIVGIVPVGGTTPLDWFYLNGLKTPPQWGIASTTLSFPIVVAGRFEFRYYSGSQVLATSPQVDVSGPALPTPPPTITDKNLSNVSTRAYVQTGDNVAIGGFIIVGNYAKKVVIRALGPSLGAAGITNTLSNPTLKLFSPSGAVIASNDDWRAGGDADTIAALGMAPDNDSEAALVATLAPGTYTASVAGVNGTKGIALLEVYDAELTGSRIGNISTRSRVELGNNIMIGGFIINGTQSAQVLVRAVGPSMAQYGLKGTLSDPTLELYNGNGSKIYSNDNWKIGSQKAQILATGMAPTDDRESAILATLAPGNYTAMVRGAKNTSGIALVEVYGIGN